MKHRAWIVAAFLLGIGTGLLLWHLMGTHPAVPSLLIEPPSVPAEAEIPPITNPFGSGVALPKELSAETFSKMIEEFSEPNGDFMYENYLSNERSYQDPIPELINATKQRGAYLGVGPEQNFTYIAAMRPSMAFIVDIRRQNMLELLMYKALFAMASNRADFVSLLFSRKPAALPPENSGPRELFMAFEAAMPDEEFFNANLQRIETQLHLSRDEEKVVRDVYRVFFSIGPELNYSSTSSYAPSGPSYCELMRLTDANGRNWSYLANEENFRFVKEMQRRNLIVPLVGDFAGPKAIRTVARYLKDHRARLGAFYVS